MPKQKKEPGSLNGWQQIAAFLGQPISVAQGWAKSGMPVNHVGRRVQASPDQPNRWLVLTRAMLGRHCRTLFIVGKWKVYVSTNGSIAGVGLVGTSALSTEPRKLARGKTR